MATYTKVKLSESTTGRMIKVAQTATAGTLIHATGTSSTIIDEVWLYAVNSDTTARKLTSPPQRMSFLLPGTSIELLRKERV